MYREICSAVLPRQNLAKTLRLWHRIAQALAESKRRRKNSSLIKLTLMGLRP